jgi:hypothetical protein
MSIFDKDVVGRNKQVAGRKARGKSIITHPYYEPFHTPPAAEAVADAVNEPELPDR